MIIKSVIILLIIFIAMNLKVREKKFSQICSDSNSVVSRFLEPNQENNKLILVTQEKVKESLSVFDEALENYR